MTSTGLERPRPLRAGPGVRSASGIPAWMRQIFSRAVRATFSRGAHAKIPSHHVDDSGLEPFRRQPAQQPDGLRSDPQQDASPPHDALMPPGWTRASCGQAQDQAKLNGIRPLEGFHYVYTAPAELRMPERVVLYSLVFGLQPRNSLEIGTFRGGSSAIICGALDDTGYGRLACVDPAPVVAPELWAQIEHRCRLFRGESPDILTEVASEFGSAFDFVFIDANHHCEHVRRDIEGVLPVLADQAYLLFHDGHYFGVKQAIDEALSTHDGLTDCGLLSIEPTVLPDGDQSVTWAGLRLLRFRRFRTG